MLLSNLRGDGAVGMMLTLAEGLADRGYQVDLLVARTAGERSRSIPASVRMFNLGAKRPVLAVPALVRYLRRSRPDVLIATEHYSGLPALYALALARVAVRCIIRQDNTWSTDVGRFGFMDRHLITSLVAHLFRRAEIIAVSKGVASDFVARFPRLANNVQTIYNPVVTESLYSLAQAPVAHPWLVPGQPPVVIAVGRLAPAKGFDLLIDAFDKVATATNARLLILGEGPERGALEGRIAARHLDSRCQLGGFQSNPIAFVSKARVFVLSSRFEGLPTVLIEALAAGVPVIATDCPSGPTEILDNGKYGTLVPPGNVEALARAIIEQLQEPRESPKGAVDWLHQFSVEASVRRHIDLIEASLAAPDPRRRRAPLVLPSPETTS